MEFYLVGSSLYAGLTHISTMCVLTHVTGYYFLIFGLAPLIEKPEKKQKHPEPSFFESHETMIGMTAFLSLLVLFFMLYRWVYPYTSTNKPVQSNTNSLGDSTDMRDNEVQKNPTDINILGDSDCNFFSDWFCKKVFDVLDKEFPREIKMSESGVFPEIMFWFVKRTDSDKISKIFSIITSNYSNAENPSYQKWLVYMQKELGCGKKEA